MNIVFNQGSESLVNNFKEDKDKINHIKEKIQEFFNMKNICFLLGSGTSTPKIPSMLGLFKVFKEELSKPENSKLNSFFDSFTNINSKENIEEILGVLYSKRIYLEATLNRDDLEEHLCNKLIALIEKKVFENINIKIDHDCEVLEIYKDFYQKVSLRNKDLARINVFTTNNDLYNEYALDSLNIHYINGFSGGINKFFNPALFNYSFSKRMDTSIEKFEPVENMVYLYKIHGSVNWIEDDSNQNSYFNIKEVQPLKNNHKHTNVLIYPAPTKQNKSLGSPYVEMFREFQKKLLESHTVLFVIGYSFSDEHINNVIYQALATNTTISVVVFGKVESKIIRSKDNRIFNIHGTIEDKKGKDDKSDVEILTTSNVSKDENVPNKDGLEQDGLEQDGLEQDGLEQDGLEQDGLEQDGLEQDGLEQDETNSIKMKTDCEEEKIHYFNYIVNNLIPNVDTYRSQDKILLDFMKSYNSRE